MSNFWRGGELRNSPAPLKARAERIEGLAADEAVLHAHADDRTVVGGRSCHPDDLLATLNHSLDSLPAPASQAKSVLGIFRGLSFGIMGSANSRSCVFLEGAVVRTSELSRSSQGARAVLNALERLQASYGEQREKAKEGLAVSKQQLSDYEARLGKVFPHEEYFERLYLLRNGLRDALSGCSAVSNENSDQKEISVSGLTDELESYLSSHVEKIDVGGEIAERPVTEEEPITVRARKADGISSRLRVFRSALGRPLNLL